MSEDKPRSGTPNFYEAEARERKIDDLNSEALDGWVWGFISGTLLAMLFVDLLNSLGLIQLGPKPEPFYFLEVGFYVVTTIVVAAWFIICVARAVLAVKELHQLNK